MVKPKLDDILKARLIITTLTMARILHDYGLRGKYFTHILIGKYFVTTWARFGGAVRREPRGVIFPQQPLLEGRSVTFK